MADHVALVTNVTEYTGLPSALALAEAGFTVVCHDRGFPEERARQAFTRAHFQLAVTAEQEPAALIKTVTEEHGKVDVLVSNDCCPARFVPIEDASLDEYRATLEALMVAPFAREGRCPADETTPQRSYYSDHLSRSDQSLCGTVHVHLGAGRALWLLYCPRNWGRSTFR